MPKPLHDAMNISDAQLQAIVRCARCDKPVQNGESHTCNTLEKEQQHEQNKES